MTDRENLIALLRSDMNVLKAAGTSATATLRLADNLIAGGVTFAKDTNVLTNADRFRAMSDEELAVHLADHENKVAFEVCCSFGLPSVEYDFEESINELLSWLKQPAEGE